nr:hypothetical protein [Tanacetum cinerariifolium]
MLIKLKLSALDSKLLSINSINSQRLDKKEQEVKIVEEQPAERRNLYDDDFEDIKYVEASLLGLEIVSIEEENGIEEENFFQREEEENEPDQERLINLMKNDNYDNSSNDPLLEEVDLFLSDDSIPPGIENVADDPEGDICFLEELLINDSILSHESSDSNFKDNSSIS